jgi:hypothetical protein
LDNPTWNEFFSSQFEQQAARWAMSHAERFEAARAMLRAVGLLDAIPRAQVRPGP